MSETVDESLPSRHTPVLAGVVGSMDGRGFNLRRESSSVLGVGDLVVWDDGGDVDGAAQAVGQVLSVDRVVATGRVLGLLRDGAFVRGGASHCEDRATFLAEPEVAERVQTSAGADLTVGTVRSAPSGVPARLRTQGFNRHTFLCGQSGSGKTYALGLLLEQLLLHTAVRMVVLDPNSDYVRLGDPLPDVDPATADRLRAVAVRVLGADGTGHEPLRLRFQTMPASAQAALIRLDPVRDRAEYHQYHRFTRSLANIEESDLTVLLTGLLAGDANEQALGQRLSNLGLLDWEVWARDLPSASEIIDSGSRATVLDLGGFPDQAQATAVSLDVVGTLWRDRHRRVPTVIVIDEAHNLCPAEPGTPSPRP